MSRTKTPSTFMEQVNTTIKTLETNYYAQAERSCNKMVGLMMTLREEDTYSNLSVFISLLASCTSQVQHMVEERMHDTIPYTTDICEKSIAGHNCLNCEDDCEKDHINRIGKIEQDHYNIRDTFARVQKIAPPLYGDEVLPPVYKQVRKELIKLNSFIFELFYLEESSLIPLILEAQRKINAIH